jgi:hypothetical protein
MKVRRGKRNISRMGTSERGWAQGKGNDGLCSECVLYIYMKIEKMKPVKIVLRRGRGGKRENDGGGKSNLDIF